MSIPKAKTSANRQKVIDEFTKDMSEDGAPAQVIELWKIQGDMNYCAFLAGKMTARRMFLEGDITEDQITDVAIKWAEMLVPKITYGPATQPPPSDLVIPKIVDLPRNMN